MDINLQSIWYKILIALLIGLLIGIDREKRKLVGEKAFAGIRTYPMISLLGFTAAFIAEEMSEAVYISIFIGFAVLVSIAYYFSAKRDDIGGTTEISMLLIFITGTLVYYEHFLIAGGIAIVMAVLLTFKTEFHSFAGRIEREDVFAAIKFAILTIIVLPLLPDKTFGPFDVFNPQKIWYMVVLIAGISFIGYILFKIIGAKKGIQLLSILGGIASSTAVTLSFTERSKNYPELSRSFAGGILLASSIMFPRVFLIIVVLNSEVAANLIVPFSIFTAGGLTGAFILWKNNNVTGMENIKLTNPFKILTAFKFGLIFAVVLFVSKIAQLYLNNSGFYLTTFFAGFADVDAIALSVINLINSGLSTKTAALAIIIATFANSLVKCFISMFWGSKELRKASVSGFSFVLLAYIITLFLI